MTEVTMKLPDLPFGYEYTGEYRIPGKEDYVIQPHFDGIRIQKQGDEYGRGYVFTSPNIIVRKMFDFPPATISITDVYSPEVLKKIPINHRVIDFRKPKNGEWYFTYYGEAVRFTSKCLPYPALILDLVAYKKEDCK
jgi:hypothetical protein